MLDLTAELSPTADEGRAARDLAWQDPARYWSGLTEATAHLPAPVAVIERDALRHNAMDLLVRAGGIPIRVATKSVRVRSVLDAVLAIPGFRGILSFTLAEALWLAEDHDDIVLGYPTVDRAGLATLLSDERLASRITLMIDDLGHLDAVRPHAVVLARRGVGGRDQGQRRQVRVAAAEQEQADGAGQERTGEQVLSLPWVRCCEHGRSP